MDTLQVPFRQLRQLAGLCIVLLLCLPSAYAQDEAEALSLPSEPKRVTTEAADGLTLVGDWYAVAPDAPTVLLLHELYTNRGSWDEVAADLQGVGFNVLAVDIRGAGETRGTINWPKAVDDTRIWVEWLRETAAVRANGISMMGSSMGSSLAVTACAQTTCRMAIALSPGWNYYNLSLEDTIAARPVLALYTERDRWPALGLPQMREAAPATLSEIALPGNAHGMDMLHADYELLLPRIVEWLVAHSG